MSVVIDSSAALAWVYSEEVTAGIEKIFERVLDHGAWAPGIWRLEVANVLEMGVRRKRHSAAFRDATLADLAQLPIRIDGETDRQAWDATLKLAQRHKLTLYDASYLELALRRGAALASLDAELRRAARAEGVTVLSG